MNVLHINLIISELVYPRWLIMLFNVQNLWVHYFQLFLSICAGMFDSLIYKGWNQDNRSNRTLDKDALDPSWSFLKSPFVFILVFWIRLSEYSFLIKSFIYPFIYLFIYHIRRSVSCSMFVPIVFLGSWGSALSLASTPAPRRSFFLPDFKLLGR